MKSILFFLVFISVFTFSQEKADSSIVDIPEKEAEFPGGISAMKNFIAKNVIYPEKSLLKNEQGRVFVEFIVEKDGSFTKVKVLEGPYRRLNKEAKRVVKAMPNWIPAEWKGEIVRARCRIPINFILTD